MPVYEGSYKNGFRLGVEGFGVLGLRALGFRV